jgi:hypothetical protein
MRIGSDTDFVTGGGFSGRRTNEDADFLPLIQDNVGISPAAFWQRLRKHHVQIVKVNQNTYLGLVPGRLTTSMLKIGDTLFIFAPRDNAIVSISDFLGQVLCHIPDKSLHALHNFTENQVLEALVGADS